MSPYKITITATINGREDKNTEHNKKMLKKKRKIATAIEINEANRIQHHLSLSPVVVVSALIMRIHIVTFNSMPIAVRLCRCVQCIFIQYYKILECFFFVIQEVIVCELACNTNHINKLIQNNNDIFRT